MAGGPSRHWFLAFLTQTAAQVVGGLILAGLLVVFAGAWVPSVLDYLAAATTPASVWLLGGAVVALVVALLPLRRSAAGESRPQPAPTPPSATPPAPPRSHPFRYLDLDWEIQPSFLAAYSTVENPPRWSLDDYIKGPFCPSAGCGRSLRQKVQHGWMADYGSSYHVENPCPNCSRGHPNQRIGETDLYDLKAEVYKEAQRLARAGKFPPPSEGS